MISIVLLFIVDEINKFCSELSCIPFGIDLESLSLCHLTESTFYIVINTVNFDTATFEYTNHILATDC